MPRPTGLPPSTFLHVRHASPGVRRNPWADEPGWPACRPSWQDRAAPGGREDPAASLTATPAGAGVSRSPLRGAGPRPGPAPALAEPPAERGGWAFMDLPLQRPSDLPPGLRPIGVRRLLAGPRPALRDLVRWYRLAPPAEASDADGRPLPPGVPAWRRRERRLRLRAGTPTLRPGQAAQSGDVAFVRWLGADLPTAREVVRQAEALALEQAGRLDPCGDFLSWYAGLLLGVYRATAPIAGKRRRLPVAAGARPRQPALRAVACPALTRLLRPGPPARPRGADEVDPLAGTAALRAAVGRQARPSWAAGAPPPFATLAAAARCRDPRAWAEILGQWDGEGWRTARAYAPATWAEDALQEAWAKLWEGALEAYDPARPFGPWFLQVVKNTARNLGRAERRKLKRLEQCALAFPDEYDRAAHAGRERREAEEEAQAGWAVEERWPWWAPQ